jgi:hypothetical protein
MYWFVYWSLYHKYVWECCNEATKLNQAMLRLPPVGLLPMLPNNLTLCENEVEAAAWRKADAAWWQQPFSWSDYVDAHNRAIQISEHSRRVRQERELLEAS